jgi:hypothetical protein
MDQTATETYNSADASWIAMSFVEWDQKLGMPLLKKHYESVMNKLSSGLGDYAPETIPQMAVVLADAGDHSVLKSYGERLRLAVEKNHVGLANELFTPLWLFQDDPAMTDTAEAIFAEPADKNPVSSESPDLLKTPLLGIKSFRTQLIHGLQDETPIGTVTVLENRRLKTSDSLRDPNHPDGDIPSLETLIAPVGTELQIRKCDQFAECLSHVMGAPQIRFYWPQADRDAAVKSCVDFLNRYGEGLRYRKGFDGVSLGNYSYGVTFPLLDHPATKEENHSTHAIFSLEGQGERRQVHLPNMPIFATWTTLKKYPITVETWYGSRTEITSAFDNCCCIWQAEEVKVNGKWQRFYGVVGSHDVATVPAADIEFDAPFGAGFGWTPLGNGVDFGLSRPGQWDNNRRLCIVRPDAPLVVQLAIHNRLGVSQDVASQLVLTLPDGKMAVRAGLKIILDRLGDAGTMQAERDPKYSVPIHPKSPQLLSAESLSKRRLLESDETMDENRLDLRNYFDGMLSGVYRLQIIISKDSGLGDGASEPVEFELQ